MIKNFSNVPQAITNTQLVADMCNVNFQLDEMHLPKFPLPDDVDHYDYMKNMVFEGLRRRYKEQLSEIHMKRAEG